MNFVIDYEATVRDTTLLEGNNMHRGFIQNEQFISTLVYRQNPIDSLTVKP